MKEKYGKRSLPKGIFVRPKDGQDYVVIRMQIKRKPVFEHVGPVMETGIWARAEERRDQLKADARAGRLGQKSNLLHLHYDNAANIFHQKYYAGKSDDKYCLRLTQEYFGQKNLDIITRLDIQGMRDWLEKENQLADATVNKVHGYVINLYNRFYEWKEDIAEFKDLVLPTLNPGERCKKVNTDYRDRTRIITQQEFVLLMTHATLRCRRIMLGLIHSLLRKCDLKRLKKSENIDRDRNCLVGFQKKIKTKAKFNPPITPDMWFLINSAEGDVIFDFKNFRKEFMDARKRAGLPDIQERDFRRTGARKMLKEGADINTVMKYLGHSDIRTTQRYVGASQAELQEASKTLSANYKWTDIHVKQTLCANCGKQKADPWAGHGWCLFCVAVTKRKYRPVHFAPGKSAPILAQDLPNGEIEKH